jgi:putative hemolysin
MTTRRLAGARRAEIAHPGGVGELREAGYVVRFARDAADLERVLRLRFEVFNRELGEGFAESWRTGIDTDRFDRACHHLMLIHDGTDELVGTYRMQTGEIARANIGFYTDQEYDLGEVPASVLERTVELGRACILKEHRNGHALYALWRGISLYTTWSRMRYLIGCCSLTSQDPREGIAMHRYLEAQGYMSSEFQVATRAEFVCAVSETMDAAETPRVRVPTLFGTYLRYGAVVCSPPALDRDFGTIDFLICVDCEGLEPRFKSMLFSNFGDALELEER